MTRPTTGIRRVDYLEGGGVLVCLYGETDLDDVMFAVVQYLAGERSGGESWMARTFVPPPWEHPRLPDAPRENAAAWAPYFAAVELWSSACRWTLDEEHPTDAILDDVDEVEAGWFRKVPCPPQMCGEHSWHVAPAKPGTHAAFLAVLVGSVYA